jgi:putative membrane protein
MQHMLMAASVALFVAAPAAAQFGNPGFYDPATTFAEPGVPAPGQANATDKLFAELMALGGLAEVSFGNLAADKAADEDVAAFARRMVEDHAKANDELKTAAMEADISLPAEISPEHKAMRETLDSAEGAAFDLAYMSGQVPEHSKAAQLLAWEIDQGQNAALQDFAAKTLPTVLRHLRTAQDLLVRVRPMAAR